MIKVIFDSSVLITCCKFAVDGKLLIEHLSGICKILIPDAVSEEAIAAGAKYRDAAVAEQMIRGGRIKVEQVTVPAGGVLDRYRLGKGEKEAIVLGTKMEADFICTDDRLAYIVANRMKLNGILCLDLLIELWERRFIGREFIERAIEAIKPRYPEGFVYHTMRILERGDRRCLE